MKTGFQPDFSWLWTVIELNFTPDSSKQIAENNFTFELFPKVL